MADITINEMPDLNLKKVELRDRASAVRLDGNATEAQVIAAEKALAAKEKTLADQEKARRATDAAKANPQPAVKHTVTATHQPLKK